MMFKLFFYSCIIINLTSLLGLTGIGEQKNYVSVYSLISEIPVENFSFFFIIIYDCSSS